METLAKGGEQNLNKGWKITVTYKAKTPKFLSLKMLIINCLWVFWGFFCVCVSFLFLNSNENNLINSIDFRLCSQAGIVYTLCFVHTALDLISLNICHTCASTSYPRWEPRSKMMVSFDKNPDSWVAEMHLIKRPSSLGQETAMGVEERVSAQVSAQVGNNVGEARAGSPKFWVNVCSITVNLHY